MGGRGSFNAPLKIHVARPLYGEMLIPTAFVRELELATATKHHMADYNGTRSPDHDAAFDAPLGLTAHKDHSQLDGVQIFLRRNVAISLGLIAHKRDPAVPDHLNPCNDVLRLRAGESNRNRTLFDARDSVG